jgi:hypothetical protein
MIADAAPGNIPHIAPDTLARAYWDLHIQRDRPEQVLPA